MANLNSLTIAYLEKLAKECGIELKKSTRKGQKIQQIKSAGIPDSELNKLIEKYLDEKKAKRTRKIDKKPDNFGNLEKRISRIESQIEKILLSINTIAENIGFDKKTLDFTQKEIILPEGLDFKPEASRIKTLLKEIIVPGNTITIDNLMVLEELQEHSLELIQVAISELIREGYFEALEGGSSQKIFGTIGKIKRI